LKERWIITYPRIYNEDLTGSPLNNDDLDALLDLEALFNDSDVTLTDGIASSSHVEKHFQHLYSQPLTSSNFQLQTQYNRYKDDRFVARGAGIITDTAQEMLRKLKTLSPEQAS
jgi:hypothetical protein